MVIIYLFLPALCLEDILNVHGKKKHQRVDTKNKKNKKNRPPGLNNEKSPPLDFEVFNIYLLL